MIRRLLPLALVLVISLPGSGRDEGRDAAILAVRIERTRGWSFSRGEMGPKSLERAGSEVFFELVRNGGPASTYRIHLIPADVIRAVALTLPEGGDLEQELGRRRETWKLVDERVIPFAPGGRRKYFYREMPEPGLYVFEEEIDGFRLMKTFRVGTFAPVVRTLGKSALVIVADLWTGEPVAGARATLRDGFLESRNREKVTDESGVALFEEVAGDGRLLVEREDVRVRAAAGAPGNLACDAGHRRTSRERDARPVRRVRPPRDSVIASESDWLPPGPPRR